MIPTAYELRSRRPPNSDESEDIGNAENTVFYSENENEEKISTRVRPPIPPRVSSLPKSPSKDLNTLSFFVRFPIRVIKNQKMPLKIHFSHQNIFKTRSSPKITTTSFSMIGIHKRQNISRAQRLEN